MAITALGCDLHVFQNAQFRENTGYLKRADDTTAKYIRRGEMRDLFIFIENFTRSWGEAGREKVKKSGFARPVGTNDRTELSFLKFQGHVIDGHDTAKGLDKIPGLKQKKNPPWSKKASFYSLCQHISTSIQRSSDRLLFSGPGSVLHIEVTGHKSIQWMR